MVNDNRVVRLPLHDKSTGYVLKGYLEVDIEFFMSSTRGLRSNQARIVEFEDSDPTPEQEVELIDRIISGLPVRLLKPANPDGIMVYKKGTPENGQIRKWIDDEVPLYDVASLHPQEVRIMDVVSSYPEITIEQKAQALEEAANMWHRLPDFDNYEINCLGDIRNRWTRRVLETVTEGNGGKYVDLHDKNGFAQYVSVNDQVKIVFG